MARKALSDPAALGFDSSYAFGREEETRPIDHLVGTAAGWGGLPRRAALYVVDSVGANDGRTPHAVTVRDVPVDAFWSVTVYNPDGSFTIHFGACGDGRVNCSHALLSPGLVPGAGERGPQRSTVGATEEAHDDRR